MIPAALVLLAYAIGAVPTSYWAGRAVYGVDLREEGSGNLGATNTYRVLGWKAAVPVLALDIGKGWLPVHFFTGLDGAPVAPWAMAYGAAALVGHVFSFWVRFRGGKGVATGAGVFLALAPWAVLVAFLVWLGLVVTTRIVSIGSIVAAVVLPFAVLATPHTGGEATLWFTAAIALFIVWAHRKNLARLLRGEERRIGRARSEVPG